MKKFSLGLVLSVLLAAQGANAKDSTVKVNGDFWEDSLSWTTMGKAYEFRWLVFDKGGQLTICGAGKFLDVSTKSQTLELLRKGKLTLNGKPILSDLSFFARLKKSDDLATATANCRDTGVKGGANSKVGLDISGRARF